MGGLIAVTQAIMGSMISPRERGRYSGYMGAVMAVSTVSGPLLGGVLTDSVGWRWCFFVCVPLAVISLIVLQRTLKLVTIKRHVKIDYARRRPRRRSSPRCPMLWVTFAGSDYAWISWQSGVYLVGFARRGHAPGRGRAPRPRADGPAARAQQPHHAADDPGQPRRRHGDVRQQHLPHPVLPARRRRTPRRTPA